MASVFKKKKPGGGTYVPWRYRYIDRTGKRAEAIGWPDKKKTLHHAQSVEAEERAIRNGEKDAPPAWREKRNTPIADVIAEYLEDGRTHGGLAKRGWSKHYAYLRKQDLKMWVKELGLKTLADIDPARVSKTVRAIKAAGRSGKTANQKLAAIKGLCYWAVKHGYLAANCLIPLDGFNDAPTTPHRELAPAEVKALLTAAPSDRQLIYRVALATGFRASELRALTVVSLIPFGPCIHLDGEFTKNRKPATLPITRSLYDELAKRSAGWPAVAPLLPMPKKETTWENFARDCAKAKIVRNTLEGKATFHSLRVCFINAVVQSGSDLKTIMELARHGSAFMSMQTYAKPNPQRLREAAEAAARHVQESIDKISGCTEGANQATGTDGVSVSASKPKGLRGKRGGTPTRIRTWIPGSGGPYSIR